MAKLKLQIREYDDVLRQMVEKLTSHVEGMMHDYETCMADGANADRGCVTCKAEVLLSGKSLKRKCEAILKGTPMFPDVACGGELPCSIHEKCGACGLPKSSEAHMEECACNHGPGTVCPKCDLI